MSTALLQRIEQLEARVARLEPKHVGDIQFIQERVANYFKLSVRELLMPHRPNRIAIPRMIAMVLSREAGFELTTIGRNFKRHYSTVVHAMRSIYAAMDTDPKMRADVIALREACQLKEVA